MFSKPHAVDETVHQRNQQIKLSVASSVIFTLPLFVSDTQHPVFCNTLLGVIRRASIETSNYCQGELKQLIAITKGPLRTKDKPIFFLPTDRSTWLHCFWMSRDSMLRVLTLTLTSDNLAALAWRDIPECARRLMVCLDPSWYKARWPLACYDYFDIIGNGDVSFEERSLLDSNLQEEDPLCSTDAAVVSKEVTLLAWAFFRHLCTLVLHESCGYLHDFQHTHGLWEHFYYLIINNESHDTPVTTTSFDTEVVNGLQRKYQQLLELFPVYARIFRLFIRGRTQSLERDQIIMSDAFDTIGTSQQWKDAVDMLNAYHIRTKGIAQVLRTLDEQEQECPHALPHVWQLQREYETLEPARGLSLLLNKRLFRAYDVFSQMLKANPQSEWRLFSDLSGRDFFCTMSALWPSDVHHLHVATGYTHPLQRCEYTTAVFASPTHWQLTALLGHMTTAMEFFLKPDRFIRNETYQRVPQFYWFAAHVFYGMQHPEFGWHIYRRFSQMLSNITMSKETAISRVSQICHMISRCTSIEDVRACAEVWAGGDAYHQVQSCLTRTTWHTVKSMIKSMNKSFADAFPALSHAVATGEGISVEQDGALVAMSNEVAHQLFFIILLPVLPEKAFRAFIHGWRTMPRSIGYRFSPDIMRVPLSTIAYRRSAPFIPKECSPVLEVATPSWPQEMYTGCKVPAAEHLYEFLARWEYIARLPALDVSDIHVPTFEQSVKEFYLPPLSRHDMRFIYLNQSCPMQRSTLSSFLVSERLRFITNYYPCSLDAVLNNTPPIVCREPVAVQPPSPKAQMEDGEIEEPAYVGESPRWETDEEMTQSAPVEKPLYPKGGSWQYGSVDQLTRTKQSTTLTVHQLSITTSADDLLRHRRV